LFHTRRHTPAALCGRWLFIDRLQDGACIALLDLAPELARDIKVTDAVLL
jgi:hypothetical protein